MNNLNLVLEVNCKCGKGNIVLGSTYFDENLMTCTVCDNKEMVNGYYVDEIMDVHNYNTSISGDVKVLNHNGSWESAHRYHFIKKHDLDIMLEGFNVICEVNGEDFIKYYRKDFEFIRVNHNPIHDHYSARKFVAKEECIVNLYNHFVK